MGPRCIARQKAGGSQDANGEVLRLTQKGRRRLAMTMNVIMGFVMLGLVMVAGLFGLLLLLAHGVIA